MQEPVKYCELDPKKVCDNCNKCNICDLDPNKICDSCGKCLEIEYGDYNEVKLDGIINDECDNIDDYLYDSEISQGSEHFDADGEEDINNSEDGDIKIEYIEDIPELKEGYDKIVEAILRGDKDVPDINQLYKHGHEHFHNDDCGNNHNK